MPKRAAEAISTKQLDRMPKRQLISIIEKEKGYEGNHATKTNYCQFTIHPKRERYEDMETTWDSIWDGVKSQLQVLRTGNKCEGFIMQLEFWTQNEVPYIYLQRQNYHIHILFIGPQKRDKTEWLEFYRYYFGNWAEETEDELITSVSQYHGDPKYAIPYWTAYLYKRRRYHEPYCEGIDYEAFLRAHEENPMCYQVNYANEVPPPFCLETACEPSKIKFTAMTFLFNWMIMHQWHINTAQQRVETYDGRQSYTYDGFIENYLQNLPEMWVYVPLFQACYNVIKKCKKQLPHCCWF